MVGLALLVPYFFVLTLYFSKVVVAIFRVMILAMFTTVIVYFSSFSFGKDMWKSALKTILASIMILFACTAAISFLMHGATFIVYDLDSTKDSFLRIHKLDLILLILLGLISTALLTEANGIANSLAGTVLSNAAVAIMTGGVAAGAALAARASKSGASSATNSLLPPGSSARSTALNTAIMAGAGPAAVPILAAKSMMDKVNALKSQAG